MCMKLNECVVISGSEAETVGGDTVGFMLCSVQSTSCNEYIGACIYDR